MGETTGGLVPPGIGAMDARNDTDKDLSQKPIDFNNKYSTGDLGPFFVYVEHSNKNIGRLFPVRVGHYLFNNLNFKNKVTDIKSIGLNRVKVIFKDYITANLLVNHDIMKSNNLIAYIPKFFTHKKGVIKMIDTFFDENYLKNAIVSSKEIVEVQRLKRRVVDPDGNVKFIPRQIIVVTFLGNSVPLNVQINCCNFIVEPYIYPVVQCFKCLRYGHTSKQCKSSDNKCRKCSKTHTNNETCESELPFCIYCKTNDHSSVTKLCPMYTKQYNIKKLMALENTSFKEAETLVNNPSYSKIVSNNRFAILNDINNFPPLPNKPENGTNNDGNDKTICNFPSSSRRKRKNRSPNRQSPLPPPKKIPEDKPSKSTPIIPNPYREEFKEYKEKLIGQITTFLNQIINNIYAQSNTELENKYEHENRVREYISSILGVEKNIEVYSLSDCSEY